MKRLTKPLLASIALGTIVCALTVHAASARLYRQLTATRLIAIDKSAVRQGAIYLTADQQRAIRIARAYVIARGIPEQAIRFIRTSADGEALGMGLTQRIPSYIAFLSPLMANPTVSVVAWASATDHGVTPNNSLPALPRSAIALR